MPSNFDTMQCNFRLPKRLVNQLAEGGKKRGETKSEFLIYILNTVFENDEIEAKWLPPGLEKLTKLKHAK